MVTARNENRVVLELSEEYAVALRVMVSMYGDDKWSEDIHSALFDATETADEEFIATIGKDSVTLTKA